MIFTSCGFLASAIAIIVFLFKGLEFYPDGLMYLIFFSLPLLIISIILFMSLSGTKQGVFKINAEYCELHSKIKGEIINVKLNNADILRIEIRDFSKTHRAVCIVLIDKSGDYGKTVFTRNGEFIKLRFTKTRLKRIQEFLPECPVFYSNIQPDEL